MADDRLEVLEARIATWEKQYRSYRRAFESDGGITADELERLESVSAKLADLRKRFQQQVQQGALGQVGPAVRQASPVIGSLRIQVRDGEGQPVAGAVLTVLESKSRGTTDGHGFVEFTGLPGDREVQVRVEIDGEVYDGSVNEVRKVRVDASMMNTVVFEYDLLPATSKPKGPKEPQPVPLGPVTWAGKRHGQLWGITDDEGLIESGEQVYAEYAKLNSAGEKALEDLARLEALEGAWRAGEKAVREAAAEAEAALGKLEKAIPAMRRRRKDTGGRDNDFGGDMDAYLTAKEEAEKIVERTIPKAAKEYDRASAAFLATADRFKAYEAGKDVERAKDKLERTKQESERWKSVFGDALDIVSELKGLEWEKLAKRALSYVGDRLVDVSYQEKFAQLKHELIAAQKQLKRLEKSALVNELEAARLGVEIAADGLRDAQGDLNDALEQLARKRVLATDELGESSTTAIAAKLIKDRGKQLQAVETAKDACGKYLRSWKATTDAVTALSKEYGSKASLAGIYVGQANRNAMLANETLLEAWSGWAGDRWIGCSTALDWIRKEGLAPFDKAVALVEKGMRDGS